MRTSLRVTALAAILLVTQQACGSPTTGNASGSPSTSAVGGIGGAPATTPATEPAAKPSSPATGKTKEPSAPAASGGGVLSGSRQVFFFVLHNHQEVPESVVAVTSSGRVEVTGDYSGRALFVPTPVSPGASEYLIKTGTLRAGGLALCLTIRSNGAKPLTVVTADCDAGDNKQLFHIAKEGKDDQGRMTYSISNAAAYLQWDPNGSAGLIAEEVGDGVTETTFVAIDRGRSTVQVD